MNTPSRRTSPSTDCARRSKFFKELEFEPVRRNAMLFGRLVHQTIEDVHKKVYDGDTAAIGPENIESWLFSNYRSLSAAEKLYLAPSVLQVGLQHVQSYVDFRAGAWDMIREAEVDVSLLRHNYILSGTVDLVEGKDDTVEVIDFKTEKKPDLFSDSDRIAHLKRQLELFPAI